MIKDDKWSVLTDMSKVSSVYRKRQPKMSEIVFTRPIPKILTRIDYPDTDPWIVGIVIRMEQIRYRPRVESGQQNVPASATHCSEL